MLCSNCGKEVPQGSAFCANCGASVTPPAPGAAPPPPAQPGQYGAPQAPTPAAAPPPSYAAAPQQPALQSQYQAPPTAGPPSPPQPGQYGAHQAPPPTAPPYPYQQPGQQPPPNQQAFYGYGAAPGTPAALGGYPPAPAPPTTKPPSKARFAVFGLAALAVLIVLAILVMTLVGGGPFAHAGAIPLTLAFRGETIKLGMTRDEVVNLLGEFDYEETQVAGEHWYAAYQVEEGNSSDMVTLCFAGSGAGKLMSVDSSHPDVAIGKGFSPGDGRDALNDKLGKDYSFWDADGSGGELLLLLDEKGRIIEDLPLDEDDFDYNIDYVEYLMDRGVQYVLVCICYDGAAQQILLRDMDLVLVLQ